MFWVHLVPAEHFQKHYWQQHDCSQGSWGETNELEVGWPPVGVECLPMGAESWPKHPLLIRWFAQNIDPEYKDHEKMEAIPIGFPNSCIRQYQVEDLEPYLQWVTVSGYIVKGELITLNSSNRIAPPVYYPIQESGETIHYAMSAGLKFLIIVIIYDLSTISDLRPDLLYASFSPRNQFRRRALFNFKENE